ncbi:MAG: phospholipase C, phosphocholine-specific [Sphingobium sp.]|nr:MAG: phospholipase C, phosphocholine-specific [Sphingobium sp.]
MPFGTRRNFLAGAGAGAFAALIPSIARARALKPVGRTGTLADVEHIVILMQENRSFDHYFGALRGVRGFGDRHPIPLPGGKQVWEQSDGNRVHSPFHLDTSTTDAIQVPGTPHAFADAQAAWGQGRLCEWPRYKTAYSMGHYCRQDIPFQYALADAFTISDAYHCSITTGTDPNRIVFWSGSGQDPISRARGEPGLAHNSEPNNLRCWVKGELPDPGYTYAGNALTWPTIPDVLEAAGISWRIYQDPNNNYGGAMHGGLAFESFRTAKPGSGLYERGMRFGWIDALAQDAQRGTLPAVSWVLPSFEFSEHPSVSTPLQGAEFTAAVLDALTANPAVWAKTVFFLTFDENDGQFDHMPPPAVPSYRADGSLAGKATMDVRGDYFEDRDGTFLDPTDTISGKIRPWGLGPRVPLYIVSPWSKGGWVHSQVADHTSIGQFIEKRFGVTIPAISPWHRAVCSDLTSAFDFQGSVDLSLPALPDARCASTVLLAHLQRPRIVPPEAPVPLFQESGTRPSRALPYALEVEPRFGKDKVTLSFRNTGAAGAVFHVYDRLHLDRLPCRYTVEAGKMLQDEWAMTSDGAYDLWVLGPNGFLRHFTGQGAPPVLLPPHFDPARAVLHVSIANRSTAPLNLTLADAYANGASPALVLAPLQRHHFETALGQQGNWYDLTITAGQSQIRLAGRLETGHHTISDPLMGAGDQARVDN